jgi:hypothetical protein
LPLVFLSDVTLAVVVVAPVPLQGDSCYHQRNAEKTFETASDVAVLPLVIYIHD